MHPLRDIRATSATCRVVPRKADGRHLPADDSPDSTGKRLGARYPVSRTGHERIPSHRWGSQGLSPLRPLHSFRHGFKDALRAAGVNEDVNDAPTRHSGGNSVARGYGWKDMVRRFGFPTLSAAVEKVCYPGLDLEALRWTP